MIHPHTALQFISEDIGYGVVATQFIPRGTVTWVLDKLDRVFTPAEAAALGEPYQDLLETYCYRNNVGHLVLCWDHGRYVNHSFKPTCLSTAYEVELAVRDIHPGEQLTDDYGYLNISRPFRAMDEGSRRKTVYPDDLVKYHRVWDAKLREAFCHFRRVEQPLRPFMVAETWEVCCGVSEGVQEMASILNCYYDEQAPPVQAFAS